MKGYVIAIVFIPMVLASTCYDGLCKNGGTCSEIQGKANCSCPANFTGATCETNVDECLVLSYACKNGAKCTDFFGGYSCRCISGWEGFDCSINKNDCITQADGSPPCLNAGICVDRVGRYDCICRPGWTGIMCQFIDQCHSNPCYGAATCQPSPFGRYSCRCPRGWSGKNCSKEDDECASSIFSPCHHGGTCVNTPGSFVCQCVPGYTGERCDSSINECTSNPCKNGASCGDYVNEFKCFCKPGWTGKTCDVDINECSSNPCKNEGQCVNELNSYNCKCKLAFTGTNCEINIDDCSDPNPCQNGATCSDGLASYTCSCASGFTGKQCETNIDDCSSPNPCQNGATCSGGTSCSLGIEPWKNCSTLTESGKFCCEVFKNGECDKHCNKVECLFDGFDCSPPKKECSDDGYCADRFKNAVCDSICNNEACMKDGLDCETGSPKLGEGTLVLVLLVTPATFRNGSRIFMRQLSAVLETIAFIKKKDNEQMIYPVTIPSSTEVLKQRSRRRAILKLTHYAVRRAAEGSTIGTEVHVDLDKRGCSGHTCIYKANDGARYLGALKSSNKLYLPYPVHQVRGFDCSINKNDCITQADRSPPCLNGGICVDRVGKYDCICPPGWTGPMCQFIDQCYSNPCYGAATCLTDPFGRYSCRCPKGWTGKNCSTNIDCR